MLKINYEVLNSKIKDFNQLDVASKYELADKVFKTLEQTDLYKIEEILKIDSFKKIYENATAVVFHEVQDGMKIVTENRNVYLVFKDDSRDLSGNFFEICDLAAKISVEPLIQAVIIGFFMNKERMNIIQSYELITGDITKWINS